MKAKYLAVLLMLAAPSVFAASFDCAKASNAVERFICEEPYLGRLDEALALNYRSLQKVFGADVNKKIKQSQVDWLKDRNQCTTPRCLVAMYKVRIDDICGLVSVFPDTTCVRSEDVPRQ